MKRSTARLCSPIASAALLALPLAVAAQEAPPPGTPGAEPPRRGLYVGVATCASATCHGSTVPRDVTPVLQNEYYTWLQEDRHAGAYEALFDERSRAIAEHLGIGAAHEAQRCLDCHALAPPAGQVAGRLEIEDGIACESCHGPASGWLEGHRSAGWTHADSVAAGMRDLRDLGSRAALCAGCHLGAPGRQVDHELIAAGHPELIFELDNFTAEMPPHWARRAAAAEGARAWALGQTRAFRDELAQLARRARGGPWPEFAEMRCDDCHHSLAEERWRWPPEAGRRAGTPAWNRARWAVLRPLAAELAPERIDEIDRRLAAVAAAVPDFAVPGAEVASRAEAAAAAVAELEPRLAGLTWDEARARSVIAALVAAGAPSDYAGAAQTLLAVNSLAAELIRRRPAVAGSGLPATIDALDGALPSRAGYDRQRFEALLGRLGEQVRGLPR